MEETNTKGKFTLPNETIRVKFIARNKGLAANVEKNHVISGGMLTNSVKKFATPLQRNGAIKNILTDEEKECLENITGLNLSVYGDFWYDEYVSLYKDDTANILHLNNPIDYIHYKILLNCKDDIAPDWASRNLKQSYQFAITREHEEMLEDKKRFDVKFEAFKYYGKIENDVEQLTGVLKLLSNKLISSNTSKEWLQQEILKIVDKEPAKFVSVIKDKDFYTKLLINEAVDAKVIIRKSNKYSTVDGLDLCNADEVPTLDNAIKYLNEPKNQEVRAIIEAKIAKAKK